MTSDVSIVSDFVAKGHQTIHHVSCAPSKIPYGGFSPVRLQTGFRRRPSSGFDLYAATVAVSEGSVVVPVQGRFHVQSAFPSSYCDTPVQRPLAPRRVLLSRRLFAYYGLIRASAILPSAYLLRPAGLFPLSVGMPEGPHFPLRVCSFVPPSVPRRTSRLHSAVAWPRILTFALFVQARPPHCPACWFSRGRVTRLQSSLYAAARRIARPSPARTFTFELTPPESPHRRCRISLRGQTANSRDRTFTGKTRSLMGCKRRARSYTKNWCFFVSLRVTSWIKALRF